MAVNRSSVQTTVEHETTDWGEPLQGMSFPDLTHNIVLLEYTVCRIRAISLFDVSF